MTDVQRSCYILPSKTSTTCPTPKSIQENMPWIHRYWERCSTSYGHFSEHVAGENIVQPLAVCWLGCNNRDTRLSRNSRIRKQHQQLTWTEIPISCPWNGLMRLLASWRGKFWIVGVVLWWKRLGARNAPLGWRVAGANGISSRYIIDVKLTVIPDALFIFGHCLPVLKWVDGRSDM